jgi:hypothetical protein
MTTKNELRALKEIHDIREQIYNEIKTLTPVEKAEQTNKIGRSIAKQYGLKIKQKV